MRIVDRLFGCVLFLGGIGHGVASYRFYRSQPTNMLWTLSFSFAVFLLAALNLLRAGRPGDRPLAWVSFAGCLVHIALTTWFGSLIGNMLDFRVLVNLILALGLAAFSVRSALAPATVVRKSY